MTRKIYFNNKPLFLVNEISAEVEEYLHHDDAVFIDEFNVHTVKAMIHEMEAERIHAGVFLHDDLEALMKAFRKRFTLIQASGGLVHTPEHELLMIFRRGKWDLPKGKLDEGEDLAACAAREIKEETGLNTVDIGKKLSTTYHTYHEFGKHILKESHWFLAQSPRQIVLTPQLNEDISKCEWVPVEKLAPYLENTHALIIDVVKEGIRQLREVKNV